MYLSPQPQRLPEADIVLTQKHRIPWVYFDIAHLLLDFFDLRTHLKVLSTIQLEPQRHEVARLSDQFALLTVPLEAELAEELLRIREEF